MIKDKKRVEKRKEKMIKKYTHRKRGRERRSKQAPHDHHKLQCAI
jgi:hypothetical protein